MLNPKKISITPSTEYRDKLSPKNRNPRGMIQIIRAREMMDERETSVLVCAEKLKTLDIAQRTDCTRINNMRPLVTSKSIGKAKGIEKMAVRER